MKNKKGLEIIYVTEDCPKKVLVKRKALQKQLAEEGKKNKISFLNYDKLVVKEKETMNEKRKTETSLSPHPLNSQPKKQQNSTPFKAIQSTHLML
ncbi:hypothetical protein EVAR_7078_1 [Eumeta japonica]|uniref:Uncharacterized protein n=1 Tax=Eumeta variegata TaxID=151549 RepID=A0A4C1XD45_EUMVA|nr:hypothetical protein EVAR_7078_1 [Eumeta japonica]